MDNQNKIEEIRNRESAKCVLVDGQPAQAVQKHYKISQVALNRNINRYKQSIIDEQFILQSIPRSYMDCSVRPKLYFGDDMIGLVDCRTNNYIEIEGGQRFYVITKIGKRYIVDQDNKQFLVEIR